MSPEQTSGKGYKETREFFTLNKLHIVALGGLNDEGMFAVEQPRKIKSSQPAKFTVSLNFLNHRLESYATAPEG